MMTDKGRLSVAAEDYRVVLFEPEMIDGIARLQRLHWASGHNLNRSYLQWKFLDNPYLDQPLIYVALAGDDVVGMRGVFGAEWDLADGTTIRIPAAADSLVHPGHRDRGLFERMSDLALTDMAERGYRHVLNLSPTAANYVTSVVSMGWRSIGTAAELSRTTETTAARRKLTARVPRTDAVRGLARAGRRIRVRAGTQVFSRLDRADPGGRVRVGTVARPEQMAAVVDRESLRSGIRHVRDSEFFAWRFRNPRSSYRFLYTGGDSLTGFLVLQNAVGRSRVNIVEWSALDPEVSAALLAAAAAERNRFGDLRIWSRSLSASQMQLVHDHGFDTPAPSSEPTRLAGKAMVRPTGATSAPANWIVNGIDLADASNWDLRMASSDSF